MTGGHQASVTPSTAVHTTEIGSDFHLLDLGDLTREDAAFPEWQLYGTARQALVALVRRGANAFGWSRLWLPTYYCHDVSEALEGLIPLAFYPGGPWDDEPSRPDELLAGDVFLVANYFGLGTRSARDIPPGVTVIEDHTHDPWSTWASGSTADYCIASLRKSIPAPDGAALWSPAHLGLPSAPPRRPSHERIAELRTAGMLLKRNYLLSGRPAKEDWRPLFLESEHRWESSEAQPSSLFRSSATTGVVELLRTRKLENLRIFESSLSATSRDWLLATSNQGLVPFGAVLVFDDSVRQRTVRAHLIEQDIYPAVLWPIPKWIEDERAHDFSARMLVLHTDLRYGRVEMERMALVTEAALAR
jgi:hypothetical protein